MTEESGLVSIKDIEINKSDILAIGIVEQETKLENEIKELRENYEVVQKEIGEADKALNKQMESEVPSHFEDIQLIVKSFKMKLHYGFGMKSDKQMQVSCSGDKGRNCFGGKDENDNPINQSIQINVQRIVDLSQKVKGMQKARQALVDKNNKIYKDITDRQRALGDLPKTERRMKAFLAAKQLEKSAEGKKLLAQIRTGTQNNLMLEA